MAGVVGAEGVVLAGLSGLILLLLILGSRDYSVAINLAFMVVLVALFLHPQSREYQRIWFK